MAETLHLVCAGCGNTNRIPRDRLADGPKCGSCREVLLTGHPIELTGTRFRSHLEKDQLPMVVDFWAPWCGPCQNMAPEYAAAAQALGSEARLFKLNTDREPDIAGQFSIRSIPTLILFKHGHEAARHSGAMGRTETMRWIRGALD